MNIPIGDGMRLRFITAFTLIPILVALIWWPPLVWAYIVMVAALVYLGAIEFTKMAKHAGIELAGWAIAAVAVLLAVLAGLSKRTGIDPQAVLLASAFCIVLIHVFTAKHTIAGLSAAFFAFFYVGYCGSFFISLHQNSKNGPALITILFVTIGSSDTGAYLVGKAIGRHKLAPKLSPNKTVEGSIAALFSGVLAGIILFYLKEQMGWLSYPAWSISIYMLTGLFLSIVGQFGDLTESLLKRNAGIKDSGAVFPGHGGALDRCDAFLFGAPALFYLTALFDTLAS